MTIFVDKCRVCLADVYVVFSSKSNFFVFVLNIEIIILKKNRQSHKTYFVKFIGSTNKMDVFFLFLLFRNESKKKSHRYSPPKIK